MTQVAAAHGYAGASVNRVVAAAGCSRATFYQHFASREDCFLAAHEAVAGRLVGALGRTEALPALERPRAALTFVLSTAERDPAAALVASFEALGAGAATRARREALFAAVEASIARCLADLPATDPCPAIPARALIGAVEGVVANRALRGDHGRAGRLLFDLLAWLDSYALPLARHPTAKEWDRLGRRALASAPAAVARDGPAPVSLQADQEARILAALPQLVADRGYAATRVADLVAAAGVSRTTFYALFDGKEDLFRAVQTAALQTSISRTAEAFFGADGWPDRVWNGLGALFAYTAENPHLAYLDMVESCVAGAPALRRSIDNRMAFKIFLQEGYLQHARARQLSALCSEAIGAGILELLRTAVLAGESERAPGLLPQAAYVALAPFLGAEAALEFVRAKVTV